jgi:hypothetical protein
VDLNDLCWCRRKWSGVPLLQSALQVLNYSHRYTLLAYTGRSSARPQIAAFARFGIEFIGAPGEGPGVRLWKKSR